MSALITRLNRMLVRILSAFGLGFGFVAIATTAHAESVKSVKPSFESEDRYLNINDRLFRYHIEYTTNHYGELEMQVSLVEAHWLARDSRLLVLVGRDTDLDNKIDAWFYNEGQVVKSMRMPAKTTDGWVVAKEILRDFSLNESRWISTLITKEILSGLFFTVEGELKDMKELEQMQIDLLDLDYKIADLEKSKDDPVLAQELKRVSNQGWKRLMERWSSTRVQDRRNRVMGDLAMFVGGGLAIKGVKFLAVKGLSTEAMSSVKTYLNKAVEQQNGLLGHMSSRVSRLTGKSAAEDSAMSLRFASESEALAWLSSKTFYSNSLKKVGALIKNVAAESWSAKGYILASQSIQIAVESYNAGYWRASEPLVLSHPIESTPDFINTVINDESLMHNVKYMTMQTTLLSGVDEYMTHRGYGLKTKMPVCSVITFVDSMSMNVLFNDHANVKRVGFDTGWELLIGTNQVLLDKYMIRKAAEVAGKIKKPGFRFVGYILAGVDQFLGYTGYNIVTKALFPGQGHGGATAPAKGEAEARKEVPPVVVIPVLAPK